MIHTHSACHIKPIKNIIRKRGIKHKTILIVLSKVAIIYPIRILHRHPRITNRPVLSGKPSGHIISFVHPYSIPVSSSRKKICPHQRVIVCTLIGHIAIFLINIAAPEIKMQLIIHKRSGITKSHIITTILVVRYNPIRIYG